MGILNLILYPNKMLNTVSSAVRAREIPSVKIRELVSDMKLTMKAHKGIGLAAPQVGFNIRLFIVDAKDAPLVFINPVIVRRSLRKEIGEEGCLSIPGVYGQVKRSKSIKVAAIDEIGKKFILNAAGLLARVIQHEHDHIDGILFIERAKKLHKVKKD